MSFLFAKATLPVVEQKLEGRWIMQVTRFIAVGTVVGLWLAVLAGPAEAMEPNRAD